MTGTASPQRSESATAEPMPLRAMRLGILTHDEPVVFMRTDCDVCRSEGLSPRSRVLLQAGDRQAIATLHQVSSDIVAVDEVGLSEAAWDLLQVADGDSILVRHPNPLASFRHVRGRIFGSRLGETAFDAILRDIAARRYSDVQTAAFITGCATLPLDEPETVALTRVMVDIGETLQWDRSPIVDKHCVGGLPGNRTTPIIVAIAAAHGLTMPKTSSRAITSPAGTADTMETMAPVDLDLPAIRNVVEQESGCVVWGGAVRLSPADDVLIRIERDLDLDSEGQLIASVLSKKIAAGATHLVIDIPVGPTAKVRSAETAARLSARLSAVATTFGIETRIVFTDGSQPVGRGIGPALEARDVLAVLQQTTGFPEDLRQRACTLAGALLELAGKASSGDGSRLAAQTIEDGRAWSKFQRICEAQGGMRVPPVATHRYPFVAKADGYVRSIDNRRIAMLAKLAGAPDAKAAGVELHVVTGEALSRGQLLCTLHAETQGQLHYALDYASANADIIELGSPKGERN